jgi:hypothetical protein
MEINRWLWGRFLSARLGSMNHHFFGARLMSFESVFPRHRPLRSNFRI